MLPKYYINIEWNNGMLYFLHLLLSSIFFNISIKEASQKINCSIKNDKLKSLSPVHTHTHTHKNVYFYFIFFMGAHTQDRLTSKTLNKKKYKYPEHRINKRIREIMVDPWNVICGSLQAAAQLKNIFHLDGYKKLCTFVLANSTTTKKYVIEAIIIILKWHFLYIIPTDSFWTFYIVGSSFFFLFDEATVKTWKVMNINNIAITITLILYDIDNYNLYWYIT